MALRLTPDLGWVTRMQQLHAASDPALANLFNVANANLTGVYGYNDRGQWSAIAYAVTNDPRYAQAAITQLLATLPTITANDNSVMQNAGMYAIFYAWLQTQMTPEQEQTYLDGLQVIFTWCVQNSWRSGDSDLLIGGYIALLFLADVLQIDLSVPTFILDTVPVHFTAISTAVNFYFSILCAGGVIDYSSEYNTNVEQIAALLPLFAPGTCPSFEALLPDLCLQHAFETNPTLTSAHAWGDCQVDSELPQGYKSTLWRRLSDYILLVCITPQSSKTAALAKVVTDTLKGDFTKLIGGGEWRWLLAYDPAKLTTFAPPLPTGVYASGTGMLRVKKANTSLHVHAWPRTQHVDHDYDVMGDVQWFSGSQWLLRHPIGYGVGSSSPYMHNAPAIVGLGSMDNRAVLAQGINDKFAYLTCETFGSRYPPSYYHPPAPFGGMQRTVLYVYESQTLVTIDDYAVYFDPRTESDFSRYRASDQAAMRAVLGMQEVILHMPSMPSITGQRFTWLAGANGPTMQGLTFGPTALSLSVPVTSPDFQLRIVANAVGVITIFTAIKLQQVPAVLPTSQSNQVTVDGVTYTVDPNTGEVSAS